MAGDERRFPLVTLFFIVVAVACGACAAFLQSDLANVLRRDSGRSLEVILELVLAGVSLVAALGALAAFRFGRRLESLCDRHLHEDDASRPDSPYELSKGESLRRRLQWLIVITALVLLFDGCSIPWGYFESDDFNLLIENRETSMPQVMFTTHNDHSPPRTTDHA